MRAGLVKLGHVALDGTKIKANANPNANANDSNHKAMSYGRMNKEAEVDLAKEVLGWLDAAEAADAEEDAEHGADRRGDEMPDWVADKHKRLVKIREAKAALEAEARAEAEEKAKQPKSYRGGRTPKTRTGNHYSDNLLALLWEMFEGHPNLLPAYFADDPRAETLGSSYVRKPLLSREGSNVEIVRDGDAVLTKGGACGAEGHVVQAFHPLAEFDGNYPILGCRLVASRAAGLCVREDRALVTSDDARFVPHVILD